MINQLNDGLPHNVCLYVGSFDPPHIGHQIVATILLNQSDIDYLVIIPTYNHCFKDNVSDFKHRLNMLKICFKNLTNVIISPIEKDIITPTQKNLTCDTIDYFKQQYPNVNIKLAMGSDLFNTFSTWKNLSRYTDVNIKIIIRQNYPLDPTNMEIIQNQKIKFDVINELFHIPNISSSLIKKNIHQNKSNNGLISNSVLNYIYKSDLLKTYK